MLGVAWQRIAAAAAVFALWRSPVHVLRSLDRDDRRLVVALGAVLAVMNACFYVAIDLLPLATVAAVEFTGPIVLALFGARTARNQAAVAAAAGGVYLLTGLQLAGEPLGVAFAFANAALFAAYIVLAHRVARHGVVGGVDGLAAGMVVAFVVVSPLGLAQAAPAFRDPVALAAGIGVGISSSVVPYVLDQLAMARIPRATYALFVALLPATALLIGVVVLGQVPAAPELAGIALVMAGVALHRPPGEAEQRSGVAVGEREQLLDGTPVARGALRADRLRRKQLREL